jgi:hypothetical protein
MYSAGAWTPGLARFEALCGALKQRYRKKGRSRDSLTNRIDSRSNRSVAYVPRSASVRALPRNIECTP